MPLPSQIWQQMDKSRHQRSKIWIWRCDNRRCRAEFDSLPRESWYYHHCPTCQIGRLKHVQDRDDD